MQLANLNPSLSLQTFAEKTIINSICNDISTFVNFLKQSSVDPLAKCMMSNVAFAKQFNGCSLIYDQMLMEIKSLGGMTFLNVAAHGNNLEAVTNFDDRYTLNWGGDLIATGGLLINKQGDAYQLEFHIGSKTFKGLCNPESLSHLSCEGIDIDNPENLFYAKLSKETLENGDINLKVQLFNSQFCDKENNCGELKLVLNPLSNKFHFDGNIHNLFKGNLKFEEKETSIDFTFNGLASSPVKFEGVAKSNDYSMDWSGKVVLENPLREVARAAFSMQIDPDLMKSSFNDFAHFASAPPFFNEIQYAWSDNFKNMSQPDQEQ